MKQDEIRKLLGGYATGTLTDEERNLLFSAVLEDQTLFDALAGEEALRELLAEPETRQELLRELRRHPESLWARIWDQLTPRRLAVTGGLAVSLLVVSGVLYVRRQSPVQLPMEIAMSRAPQSENDVREQAAAEPPAAGQPKRKAAAPAEVPAEFQRGRNVRVGPKPQTEAPRKNEVQSFQPPAPELARKDLRAADEKRAAPPAPAGKEMAEFKKKVEKESPVTESPREEKDRAVRDQIAPSTSSVAVNTPIVAIPPPPAVPAPVPGAPARKAGQDQAKTAEAASKEASEAKRFASVGRVQGVGGGFRQTAQQPEARAMQAASAVTPRLAVIDAKVTDVNGSVISINAGTRAGLKAGETLEIVRDDHVIGTIKLTEAGDTFAVGPFQHSPGKSDTPRTGDTVRRPAEPHPPK